MSPRSSDMMCMSQAKRTFHAKVPSLGEQTLWRLGLSYVIILKNGKKPASTTPKSSEVSIYIHTFIYIYVYRYALSICLTGPSPSCSQKILAWRHSSSEMQPLLLLPHSRSGTGSSGTFDSNCPPHLPNTSGRLYEYIYIYYFFLKSWKSFLEVRSGGNSTLHYISLRTPGIPIYALACRTFASKSSAWILFHSMFDQVHSNAKHCSGGEWSWLLEGFSVVRFSEPRSLWRR